LVVSVTGGFVAGLLLAPSHRIAGALGGMVAAPSILLVLAFYARDRNRMYRAEVVLIALLASLPGLGVYFLLKLFTDALFPAAEVEKQSPPPDEVYLAEDDDGLQEPPRR
jgi:hypothetical protein